MPIPIFIPILIIICCFYMHFEDKYNVKSFHIFAFISLMIFSFLLGVRTNIGIDHLSYLNIYTGQRLSKIEPIFAHINTFLYSYRVPYQCLFIIVSFLEFYFLEQTIKHNKINWAYTTFLFFILHFPFFTNGLRQAIAMVIALSVLKDFYQKKYFKWLFMMLIACGFHKSLIIMILFCPFCKMINNITIKRCLSICFFIPLIFLFFFYSRIYEFSFFIFNSIKPFIPKDYSFIIDFFLSYTIELGTGRGAKLQILGYIFVLPKLIKVSKQDNYTSFLFYLFYFGMIFKFSAGGNMNLGRLVLNMSIVELILLPKAMMTINKKNVLNLQNIIFCFGLLAFFIIFLRTSLLSPMKTYNNTSYIWDLDFTFKEYFGK